jgi:deazaflavin-dependent oxidoreductase (nitroreductase family)
MSDETFANIAAARRYWKTTHLQMYLRSGGAEGHIMDMRDIGGHRFTTNLLVKCVGRKSGRTIVTPLIYGDMGGEVVICASKGGAARHPDWYLNIKASKEIRFQVATQAFRATWREPEGEERAKVWDFMQGVFPPYTTYQASTRRVLPLVMFAPIEPAEIFRE